MSQSDAEKSSRAGPLPEESGVVNGEGRRVRRQPRFFAVGSIDLDVNEVVAAMQDEINRMSDARFRQFVQALTSSGEQQGR